MKKQNNPKLPSVKKTQIKEVKVKVKSTEPESELKASQTLKPEQYPKRPAHTLKDAFPELPERSKSYLKLWPYGDNMIINKAEVKGLLQFFFEIRQMPLPDTIWPKMLDFQDRLRHIIGLVNFDETEDEWRRIFKEHFEPFYPEYKCTCYVKKRNGKKSKSSKDEDSEDE